MSEQPSTEIADKPPAKQSFSELMANLALNIIIPTLILTKLSGEEHLGPAWAIVVALLFPVGYGLFEYIKTRKTNFFSLLGVFSVIMTGGMSLLELPPEYIAIKEAAIPGILGLVTLASTFTSKPLVKLFVYNEQILRINKVDAALEANNNVSAFEKKLTHASYMVAGSFFMSSVLNFVLAKVILVSEPGTPEFTAELGKMTALSFPVIAVPSMIVLMFTLFYLVKQIEKLTKLSSDDIFNI